jgi:EAL domain-containing protein (putative c-di-GMP-specific phosphodiesterase class I)
MDFALPDMDGAAATRLLKQACPSIKVIAITGVTQPGAYYAAIGAGSSAWLRKTRASKDLIGVVHRVYHGEVVVDDELSTLPTLEQFVVHYQPIVKLTTDDVVGVEALVRWQHPDRGLLPPGEFLARAEETGFIYDMGRHIGNSACHQLAQWTQRLTAGRRLWVSVNVSASGIRRASLVADIASAIEMSGIRPEDLVLEITETVLIEDGDLALVQFNRLKKLGVKLALDDFGTGYSSLSYLRQFPLDLVKIDGSFTAELPSSSREMRFAEATHQLVSALGMQGIAEGIEREDQAHALRDVGWEFAQGFLYSRPVDAAAVAPMLGLG